MTCYIPVFKYRILLSVASRNSGFFLHKEFNTVPLLKQSHGRYIFVLQLRLAFSKCNAP